MKSTNIFMLPISIFICLYFFFIQGHFCPQVYSNCLLGVKKVNTHSFRCTIVRLYDSTMEENQMIQALITFNQRVVHQICDWAKYQNRHNSKSLQVIKLSFCQNDPPMGESFWQKDILITILLFELCLFMIFSPVANLMHHPLAGT